MLHQLHRNRGIRRVAFESDFISDEFVIGRDRKAPSKFSIACWYRKRYVPSTATVWNGAWRMEEDWRAKRDEKKSCRRRRKSNWYPWVDIMSLGKTCRSSTSSIRTRTTATGSCGLHQRGCETRGTLSWKKSLLDFGARSSNGVRSISKRLCCWPYSLFF